MTVTAVTHHGSMPLLRRLVLVVAVVLVTTGCGGFGGRDAVLDCVGLSPERCQQMHREALGSVPPGASVTSVSIRCTVPSCTEAEGEAEMTVVLVDGQRLVTGQGWAAAPAPAPAEPAPQLPLPVDPVCLGVTDEQCVDFARSGADSVEVGGAAITRIVVRCIGVCTPLKGEGTTDVTLADGTTQSSSWGYQGGG
jgi:hypothetical protein